MQARCCDRACDRPEAEEGPVPPLGERQDGVELSGQQLGLGLVVVRVDAVHRRAAFLEVALRPLE